MSEETQEDVVLPTAEEVEASESQETPALTEAEQKAYEKGWRPETEYTGDGEWIDAEEFNGRAPLYDGLSKQSKRIKALEGVVKTLADQTKKADKVALDKARAELKAERAQAMRDEDFEKAVDLEDKQRELDNEAANVSDEADAAAFNEWKETNDWYDTNSKATRYARAYGAELAGTEHGLTSAEFYEKVEKEVKATFPELSGNKTLPRRGAAPDGQGAARRKPATGKYNQLSDDQKAVCRELTSMGVITQEDYVKQLFDMGELG